MYQRQSSRRALSGWAVGIVLLAATPLIVASGARAADGDKKVKPKVGTATSSLTDGGKKTTESFVKLRSASRGLDTLRVRAGEPVEVDLDLPGDGNWKDANIGQFQVRTYGKQVNLDDSVVNREGEVNLTFADPGWALVILGAGPPSEKGKSDSWRRTTHNAKLVVRVDPKEDQAGTQSGPLRDCGVTAKVGMKIELLPYLPPYDLEFSNDPKEKTHLPVRVYWESGALKDVTVHAYGPNGAHTQATTDGKGIAHVELTAPGRWLIRHTREVDGTTYSGDLVFDAGNVSDRKGGGR